MAKEFQESEVIFSHRDRYFRHDDGDGDDYYYTYREMVVAPPPRREYRKVRDGRKSNKKMASSLPIGIPHPQITNRRTGEEEGEEESEDDEELIPPHMILERRVARKMAFSLCSGNGRTLKGRDLSQVRNSILRMTGFLEA